MNVRVAWVSIFVAVAAQAQPLPAFELERLRLHPGAAQGLITDTGDLLPAWGYRAAVSLHYEHAPLVVRRSDGTRTGALVAGRWTTHLAGAFAPTDFLELGAQLPVVLGQTREGATPGYVPIDGGASLGTAYLHARLAVLRQANGAPIDLSGGVALGLPLGSRSALTSEESVTVVPTIALGRALVPWLRLGGSVSVLARPTRGLAGAGSIARNNEIGSFFTAALALSTQGHRLRGELSGRVDVPFTASPTSGELLGGVRYAVLERLELFALGGPGFGEQPGTPAFRAMVGVALISPAAVPAAPALLAQPSAPVASLDDDGDGVLNAADACPQDLGRAALQGCPEHDRDGDGVLDGDDRCVTVPGVAALSGCLPPDADSDGVPDARDACPTEAAPGSLRGCPDADGDGLDALADRCPDVQGVVELAGCPDRDSDGDGVVDRLDACVHEKGVRPNQGCPEKSPVLVSLTRERLLIKDKVYFASGRSQVLPQSFALLTQIARVLKEHPEVERVSIEGHTDSRGKREANLTLSQARAEAVRQFLVGHGVAAERISATGFGPDRPVLPNDTAAGRDANRRVDFVIVGQAVESPR